MADANDATRNRILALLSQARREALCRSMTSVRFGTKEIVYDQNQEIDAVYFPQSAVFSMLSIDERGTVIETATMGREGIVGPPVFLQGDRIPLRVYSQIPGECLKMARDDFREAVGDLHGELTS